MIRKNFFVNKWVTRSLKIGVVLAALAPLVSCSGDDDEDLVGNWVELSVYRGVQRTDAAGTGVGNYGYVGTGIDRNNDRLSDFYRYDVNSDQWTAIAEFPGTARNSAVAFEAGGKLYVGAGYDAEVVGTYCKDFYEYDPATNQWTQIADLITENGRIGAVAFTVNNNGYVGMGYDGTGELNDMYRYNASSDTWTEVSSFTGRKLRDAVAFTINDVAYVCTGVNNGSYRDDFYSYNAENDAWTRLNSISDATDESFDDDYDIVRNNAVAFTTGGMGYIATGGRSAAGSTVWEYNPTTDEWTEKTGFEGSPRYNAVAFTVNGQGYVTTGQNSSYYFDDLWRFDPNAEYDDQD